ncbi:MAG: outer membrane protein assembly factor [Magnetococcales bacterium]|nr:outer membrane protein assembly factor [Magnetococcales bacterium]
MIPGNPISLVAMSYAEEREKTADEKPLAYSVALIGLESDPEMAELATDLLVSKQKENDPPISRYLLVRRLDQDRKRLIDLVKSRGFFDGEVTVELRGEPNSLEVKFHVTLNVRYLLGSSRLQVNPGEARFLPPPWEKLGLKSDDPADSARIIQAGTALVQAAQEQGFPRARMVKRQVKRDRESHRVEVIYHLETGVPARLGAVVLQGAQGVDEAFLKRRVPWSFGVPYHPKRLEETRQAFTSTGLFGVVRVRLADKPDAQGLWPVEVELKERKQRTWKAGGGFSTDRGVVVNGGWEHRNFAGSGERFKSDASVGVGSLTISGGLEIPDYRERGQKLKFSGKLDKATEEAFENVALELGAGVVRPVLSPGGELSLTIHYRLSHVLETSTAIESSYSVASLPLGLTLDRTNDPLDAHEGWRLSTEIAPYVAVTGKSVTFWRSNNKASRYYTWPEEPRLVLAGRGELDITQGAGQEEIPADTRLYAGGGASVRGYGHQMAGPLDTAGKPLGGRSLLALGAEARYRITDPVGVVAFLDGGRAFTAELPDKHLDLLYGAGAGVRYMSPIGPLRLDVAVPLERRGTMDAPWQLYMSIGQAF